ncbi:MAG: cytochrome c biogenesis protein CcsA [Roseimicrobium sp.]
MDLARLLLLFSTLAFIGGLVQAVVMLRAGAWRESRWHLLPMALGFTFQCAFLYLRGQAHGRCPLTNLFEVFIFIGWCIVLLYFLVGTTYRLSLLGVFTAPLVALLQTMALLSPLDTPVGPVVAGHVNPWRELHATVALVAYAAFALACITGVMFLLQDHLLKRHRVHALFHQLPPISHLSKAIVRMVTLGVVLLAVAMGCTFQLGLPITHAKLLFSWGVLGLYSVILALMWLRALGARPTAWLAVLGFLLPFISLWIVTPKP